MRECLHKRAADTNERKTYVLARLAFHFSHSWRGSWHNAFGVVDSSGLSYRNGLGNDLLDACSKKSLMEKITYEEIASVMGEFNDIAASGAGVSWILEQMEVGVIRVALELATSKGMIDNAENPIENISVAFLMGVLVGKKLSNE